MTRRAAAYGGPGWRARAKTLGEELRGGRIWAPLSCDSEFGRLLAVLLHLPGPELDGVKNPDAVQHLARVDRRALARELTALERALKRRGALAARMPRRVGNLPGAPPPNLLFARDLFFSTREGAVIARMGSRVRAGEEKFACAALAGLGAPILRTISGRGLFEGADALWLDRQTVLCGLGRRTNAEGLRQLAEALRPQGARVVPVRLPEGVQHLLGLLQIVDARLALARVSLLPRETLRLLAARGLRVVAVPENEEVVERQGMNLVTLSPGTVLMPDDCPGLRGLYARAGIRVAAQLRVRELRKGAGGLACAVGVISREPRR